MTNLDMIAEVRKPGKIEMPVLAGTDVAHLIVEKADLIRQLEEGEPNSECNWALFGTNENVRRLDVA